MCADVDTLVIGAGVVGLAAARALSYRGHEVVVLERHAQIGAETSSRSSEVIHAGLYYPPGSLRARFCVEGKELLYRYAAEHGVPHKRVGKLLVATTDDEIPALEAIARRAAENGVVDLVRLDAVDARKLEPALACVAAYLSPSTGVIDSHNLMQALERDLVAMGGSVVLRTEVTGLSRDAHGHFAITTECQGETTVISARRVVIAAGLEASRIGSMLCAKRGYRVPTTYPARGHYFMLNGKAPFTRLVYPVPQSAFLGIHLTIDVAGQAKFGPDHEWLESRFDTSQSYAFSDPDGMRLKQFEREVRRYWPGLPAGALSPGYVGIRPKLYREGEAVRDFEIHTEVQHGEEDLVALYGIESPGLTSALAIGEHVAALCALAAK